MPCSGDIKAKRPIPLTTPQILPPLFYCSCYRSCYRSCSRSCSFVAMCPCLVQGGRICAGLVPRGTSWLQCSILRQIGDVGGGDAPRFVLRQQISCA